MTSQTFNPGWRLPTPDNIIRMISWQLKLPSSLIFPYTRFKDDLHLDAVDQLLLIAGLESRLRIFLSAEEVEAIETVQDASFYFQKKAA